MNKFLLNVLSLGLLSGAFALSSVALAQLVQLRAPGDWNGWENYQDMPGEFNLTQIAEGESRFVTTFNYLGASGSVGFKFVSTGGSGVWHDQWGGHSFTLDAVNSVGFCACNLPNNTAVLNNGSWYTLVFQNSGFATTNVSFMETSAEPVGVSATSRITAAGVSPAPGQNTEIGVTLTAPKSADERVYLVYTSDAWATRESIEVVNFSGATGSQVIPGQAAGTAVEYYVMTSTMDLTGVPANVTNYDLRAIAIGGSGSFVVANSWESAANPGTTDWEDTGYWAAGAVPPDGADVTLGANVTLTADRTVGDLFLSGGTFSASDASPRTLTIGGNLTASGGTFDAAGGHVVFSGGNVVSGTVTFNDVTLEGGVDFGNDSEVTGTLEISAGGFVNANAPSYASGSLLSYNSGGTYGLGMEWNSPHHVRIESGVAFELGASTAKSCSGDLTINASGSLDMGTMAESLMVLGDVTINGSLSMSSVVGGDLILGGDFQLTAGATFNENDRALTFNGSGPQAITGTTPLSLKYLILDKSSDTLKLQTPLEMEAGGILWPTSGVLALNGYDLTMHSGAAGTAAIGAVGDTIIGAITFERYVPGNDNAEASFVNLSVCVANIPVVNWTGAGANHVYHYNESVVGGLNAGWVATSGNFEVGRGYMAQFPGNSAVTLTTVGGLTSGPVNVDVTWTDSGTAANDGWNLIGNPYPAPFTFNALTWTPADGAAAPSGFYVYDGDNGAYTQKLSTDVVAIGQSFWIQANGGGTLTFNESDKTTNSDPFVRSSVWEPESYALRVTDASGKWSRGIRTLHPEATDGFDPAFDLRAFGEPVEGERVAVWFTADDDTPLSIAASGTAWSEPLAVQLLTGESGYYAFDLDPEYGTPEGQCIVLVDAWTQSAYPLTDSTEVILDLAGETHYANRFSLVAHTLPEPTATATWCGGGAVDMAWEPQEAEGWQVTWSFEGEEGTGLDGLSSGLHLLTWTHSLGSCAGSSTVDIPAACKGEFTGDASRGVPDLLALLPEFQGTQNVDAFDCDCDGSLGVSDLLEFLVVFGLTCE